MKLPKKAKTKKDHKIGKKSSKAFTRQEHKDTVADLVRGTYFGKKWYPYLKGSER
jgi:hypothetical protein